MPGRPTRAAAAIEAALREQLGVEAPDRLAAAQARIAWDEVVVEELGLIDGMTSALVGLNHGVGSVEASDAMLAQELSLRKPGLLRRLNARLRDRPASGAPVVELRVRVNRRLR